MFIQTETTPNPDTLKFIPGQDVSLAKNYDFRDKETADQTSPLAAILFKLDGISGVFLGRDFISVSKDESANWPLLKPRIMAGIMDHYSSGKATINGEGGDNAANADAKTASPLDNVKEEDKQIVSTIIELLDERIRPAVAQDGGDIIFHRYEDGIVYLEMHGACAGCPSSTVTLKAGIESMLQHYIPEITEVRPVV